MTALLDFKNEDFIGIIPCEKFLLANRLCRMAQQEDWQE